MAPAPATTVTKWFRSHDSDYLQGDFSRVDRCNRTAVHETEKGSLATSCPVWVGQGYHRQLCARRDACIQQHLHSATLAFSNARTWLRACACGLNQQSRLIDAWHRPVLEPTVETYEGIASRVISETYFPLPMSSRVSGASRSRGALHGASPSPCNSFCTSRRAWFRKRRWRFAKPVSCRGGGCVAGMAGSDAPTSAGTGRNALWGGHRRHL